MCCSNRIIVRSDKVAHEMSFHLQSLQLPSLVMEKAETGSLSGRKYFCTCVGNVVLS